MKRKLLIEIASTKMYCFERVSVKRADNEIGDEFYIPEIKLEMRVVSVPKKLLSLTKETFKRPPELWQYEQFLIENS